MGNGSGKGGNGDPSPAFDARFGTAHMAQLSAATGNGPNFGHIDVSVSTSFDGGLTWKPPTTVAIGQASIGPSANGVFLDKEWLVADNYPSSPHYGRLYLSWDQLEFSKGAFLRSPVVLSHSDDAGKTWSHPVEISGSNPAGCTAHQGIGAAGVCDESFFSYGAVEPNGDVVVGFA
jgi:Neuraminidase (sialidase)